MMQVSGIMGLRQAMEYNFNRSKLIIGLLNYYCIISYQQRIQCDCCPFMNDMIVVHFPWVT